jgi:transposase
MTQTGIRVTGGVDTHKDTHTVAGLDQYGRELGTRQFPATARGYRGLYAWLSGLGTLEVVGIEGTGSYGAALSGYLASRQVPVLEIDRPERAGRRRQGKSDPLDALAAARAALGGRRTVIPKQHDGKVESLRVLHVARRSAVDQRSDTQRQIKSLLVTAPERLRARLRALSITRLVTTLSALRPDPTRSTEPTCATELALRALARRHQNLTTEINDLDALIKPLVAAINPELLKVYGIGPQIAAKLLISVGENSERMRTEASFAMLAGAAPLPASSGLTSRHRLNRGGDRQANSALYRIAITRLAHHQLTQEYMRRRTTEGLSKKEIIRCLKRYIAREIYPILINPHTTPNT